VGVGPGGRASGAPEKAVPPARTCEHHRVILAIRVAVVQRCQVDLRRRGQRVVAGSQQGPGKGGGARGSVCMRQAGLTTPSSTSTHANRPGWSRHSSYDICRFCGRIPKRANGMRSSKI
jgi:hypothetical protein